MQAIRFYYTLRDGTVHGSIKGSDLSILHSQGMIDDETPVIEEGGASWKRYADQFPEFSPKRGPFPPPTAELVPLERRWLPTGRTNMIRFGPVLRDVVIIWVLTAIGGAVVGAATRGGQEFMASLAVSNLLLGTVGFTISACLAPSRRWAHLALVAFGAWLTGLLNVLFFTATLVIWMEGAPTIALMAALGGGIWYLFGRNRKQKETKASFFPVGLGALSTYCRRPALPMNKKILIAALCLAAASCAFPPVAFRMKWSGNPDLTTRYVEYRLLWDMEPRQRAEQPNVNEYLGIDFPRFGIQLFGIATLGFALSLALRPEGSSPLRKI